MDLDDYVIIINKNDQFYGYKFKICGVQRNFFGQITCYTVHDGYGRHYRDYDSRDVQYTTRYSRKFTSQMQLL